jgi:hypothetical protein
MLETSSLCASDTTKGQCLKSEYGSCNIYRIVGKYAFAHATQARREIKITGPKCVATLAVNRSSSVTSLSSGSIESLSIKVTVSCRKICTLPPVQLRNLQAANYVYSF